MLMSIRRRVFEGNVLLNFRDIGGYVCEGGMTKYGQLFRSDQLCAIGHANINHLRTLGLKHVVDLRSSMENDRAPNDFMNDQEVHFYSFETNWDHEKEVLPDLVSTCQGHDYIKRIEGSKDDYYPNLIRLLAESEGMTVFHCAAGKDRTGIAAAFVQSLLGVCREDIIADYQISSTYLAPTSEDIIAMYPDLPVYKFRSDAHNMEIFLDHLEEHYQGAKGYLNDRGMEDSVIDSLRRKMVVPLPVI